MHCKRKKLSTFLVRSWSASLKDKNCRKYAIYSIYSKTYRIKEISGNPVINLTDIVCCVCACLCVCVYVCVCDSGNPIHGFTCAKEIFPESMSPYLKNLLVL